MIVLTTWLPMKSSLSSLLSSYQKGERETRNKSVRSVKSLTRCLLTNFKEHLARKRAKERAKIEEMWARAMITAWVKKMAAIPSAQANLNMKVAQARTEAVVPNTVAHLFDQSTIKGLRRIKTVWISHRNAESSVTTAQSFMTQQSVLLEETPDDINNMKMFEIDLPRM